MLSCARCSWGCWRSFSPILNMMAILLRILNLWWALKWVWKPHVFEGKGEHIFTFCSVNKCELLTHIILYYFLLKDMNFSLHTWKCQCGKFKEKKQPYCFLFLPNIVLSLTHTQSCSFTGSDPDWHAVHWSGVLLFFHCSATETFTSQRNLKTRLYPAALESHNGPLCFSFKI